jgi:Predicted pPIWI-associating nuclease
MDKILSIEKYLTTEFEQRLFRASVSYLSKLDDPLRFNSFAYSMREIYRHVLARLSPEEQIIKCGWFKPETDNKKSTRKQKLKYAVQGGLDDDYVMDELCIDIDEFWRTISKSQDLLSKYTHVNEDTFDISNESCDEFSDKVLNSLMEIFQLISNTKNDIFLQLQEHIDEELLSNFAYTAMEGIDILSNNSYVEELGIEEYQVLKIDSTNIYLTGEGTVYVSLNYGGNADEVELNTNFPFKLCCSSSVLEPTNIQITEKDISIDISGWYDDTDI